MYTLGDFDIIRNNLSTVKRAVALALHKFVFQYEGDRSNRQRLRRFEGFDFDEDDDEYKLKTDYVKQNLSTADLVSICNVLCLNYDLEDLCQHIFKNLRKGMLLKANELNDDDDDDEIEQCSNLDDDYDDQEQTLVNDDDDNEHKNIYVGNDDGASDKNKRCATLAKKMKKNDDAAIECKNSENPYDEYSHRNNSNKNNNRNEKQYETNSMQQCNVSTFNMPRFAINFRDIEDSMRTFDGSGNLPIMVWINEFEPLAFSTPTAVEAAR